jgi:sigma-B regulation protein RsbU (phosphoserine phosphatase)
LGSPPVILEGNGFPIGVGKAEYREQVVRLQEGDRLVLCADGLTEAKNAEGEHFGARRLLGALEQTRHLPLEESLQALLANVEEWRGNSPLHDDLGLLAAEIVAPQPRTDRTVAEPA